MYVSNPFVPKVRRLAVNDVLSGRLNQNKAAVKYGVVKSTISKWMKRAPVHNVEYIQTQSSRPHHHPHELSPEIVAKIVETRKQLKRCAQVIHAQLVKEEMQVSLSSVKRVFKRYGLTKRRRAVYTLSVPNRLPSTPGSLVQADTIHFMNSNDRRFYIYAVIDTCTRLTYAEYHPRLSVATSYQVITNASREFGFSFRVVQTDHGSEFSQSLYFALQRQNIPLKHSRVRRPNDNAFIERFNRTLQEECFNGRTPNQQTISRKLQDYLVYYNKERLHLSLNCQTPIEFVSKVLS